VLDPLYVHNTTKQAPTTVCAINHASHCSSALPAIPSKQEKECGSLWRLLHWRQQMHTAGLQVTATAQATTKQQHYDE
jgi:hypothetical protein